MSFFENTLITKQDLPKSEVDKIKDIVGFNDEKFKEFVNLNFMKIKNDKIIISDSARFAWFVNHLLD